MMRYWRGRSFGSCFKTTRTLRLSAKGANALETIDLVQFTNPDLILLDMHMPDMDGFDIVSALSSSEQVRLPKIIFTTAYDKYAIRAFEINAIDYLLKPFTRERLKQAFQRAREQTRCCSRKWRRQES